MKIENIHRPLVQHQEYSCLITTLTKESWELFWFLRKVGISTKRSILVILGFQRQVNTITYNAAISAWEKVWPSTRRPIFFMPWHRILQSVLARRMEFLRGPGSATVLYSFMLPKGFVCQDLVDLGRTMPQSVLVQGSALRKTRGLSTGVGHQSGTHWWSKNSGTWPIPSTPPQSAFIRSHIVQDGAISIR